MNRLNNFNDFVNENENKDLNIQNLFFSYSYKLGEDSDWSSDNEYLIKNLRKSLELIGDGEIINKSDDGEQLMYREYLEDDSIIFIVHASISKYTGVKTYSYEISVWRNNPRLTQIGGGYGASGISQIKHTNLLNSVASYTKNRNVVSKVSSDVKKYIKDNII